MRGFVVLYTYLGSVGRGTSRCIWTYTRGPGKPPLVTPLPTGRTEDCTPPSPEGGKGKREKGGGRRGNMRRRQGWRAGGR